MTAALLKIGLSLNASPLTLINVDIPLHQEPGQTEIDRGQSLAHKPRSARPWLGWPSDKNPGKPQLARPIP